LTQLQFGFYIGVSANGAGRAKEKALSRSQQTAGPEEVRAGEVRYITGVALPIDAGNVAKKG